MHHFQPCYIQVTTFTELHVCEEQYGQVPASIFREV